MGDATQVSTVAKNALVTKSSEEKEPRKKSVPFHKLFSFADPIDKVLMTLGTIAAIGHGFARPLMALLLGELVDAFGGSLREGTVSRVSKVSLKFVIVACCCGVGAFLQVACWMITGQRQAARVKCLYLKAILRQEIGYFDREASAGELIGRMASDTFLLQDAIGEKVGKFVEVVSGVLGGLAIAFIKGWLLALVLLSLLPLILVPGRLMMALREKKISKAQIAYGNAANVVHETIGSIRTIASLAGEKHAIDNYNKFLTTSYKFDMAVALNNGVESGFNSFLAYSTIGLGVWIGSKLILHQHYTAGQVFSIVLAVALGISSTFLRQAYPPICAFAAGQVAGFKIFQVINRKPTIDAYDSKGKILENICGDIEFRDIGFTYPSRPTELVFDGFSLFIPSGTTMALVGQSGMIGSYVLCFGQNNN